MSFLSFIGSSFTTTNVISQIYNNPDFTNFMKNINDKPTPIEVIETFIRNYILRELDPQVIPLLQMPENLNIFESDNMTNLEKSKLFFGKLTKHFLDGLDFETTTVITEMLNFISNGNGNIGVRLEGQDWKKTVIQNTIEQLNDIPELNHATNPTDVYRIVVETRAKQIASLINSILMPMNAQIGEEPFLNRACEIMGKFNSCYEYQSNIYKEDDSDYSSSTNSDDDAEEDIKDDVPKQLKRADAMINVDELRGNNNSKKPKK